MSPTAGFGAEIPHVAIVALIACQKFAPLADPPPTLLKKVPCPGTGGDAAVSPVASFPLPGGKYGEISPGMSSPCAALASTPHFPPSRCSGKRWMGKKHSPGIWGCCKC